MMRTSDLDSFKSISSIHKILRMPILLCQEQHMKQFVAHGQSSPTQ